MRLRLHHSPLACSLASRLALLEARLDHDVVLVRTSLGEQHGEAFARINPRRQVPALETPEGVLTESSAILPFIADLAPERRLIPPAGFRRAEAQAWLGHLATSVHPRFAVVMGLAGDPDPVQRERLSETLLAIDAHLEGREHLLDAFSVCDLYLFVFALWRAAAGPLPAMPNLDAFQQRMLARPGVTAVVGEEMRLRAQAA